jgi:hypothetical protein
VLAQWVLGPRSPSRSRGASGRVRASGLF